jgi:Periplasmic copper-binding protein (NosD)
MFSKKLPGAVAAAAVALGVGASAADAQAAINVTSSANAGAGTLRSAINQANAGAGLSVIHFNLPAAGTTITPAFDLSAFTAPVILDGYSQPGAAGQPVVTIDAVNTTRALELATDDSVIQGVVVNESSGAAAADGIQVTGDSNSLKGNYIGTDAAGASLGFWNLTTGVAITGDQNLVAAGVIAESNGDGVAIAGDENVVLGNRLGLPFGGGLGNSGNGLSITGNHNRVGDATVAGRNVIAENNADGVAIAGNQNRVEGNYVGVDETGATGPGNVGDGVSITGNQNLATGNVSSRNNGAGVLVDGTSNTITFNAIGTDAGMTVDLGNSDGVVVDGNSNLVGGTGDGARNVISGNSNAGVEVTAGQNNRVQGNRIGTDGVGGAALPNDEGVLVNSSFNVIEDNLLSGNSVAGVKFDADGFGPPINNIVEDNVIGLDAGATVAVPNETGVIVEDAHLNAIIDNTISGNEDDGVLIEPVDLANADSNWLTGNTIEDNGLSGVRIDGGDDNDVGQPDDERNTIAGNGDDGVTVATGQDNSIANNSIHDNDDLGIDLAADGRTFNDGLLDPDAGPNGLQNHPTITGRALVFEWSDDPFPFLISKSRVSWALRSAASTDYRLEFYVSNGCDASGRGEAPDLVATRDVTTDANGLHEGSLDLDLLAPGETVAATATVTDPNGVVLAATSELSPCG